MTRKQNSFLFFTLFFAAVSIGFFSNIFPGPSFPGQRIFELTYTAKIPVPGKKTSQPFKVWLPVASESAGQKILSREINMPEGARILKDPVYGNFYIYYELPESPARPLEFSVNYKVKREQAGFKAGLRGSEKKEDLDKYLKPSRLTQSTEQTRQWAQEAVAGKTGVHEKAEAIYNFVFETMSYDKSTPGWGQGNTLRACLLNKGNCTDFHSLFITMARDAGIPARFKIGLTVPGDGAGKIPGYHCWAEYYAPGEGWFPVDVSDAWKKPEWKKTYFRNFDTNKFMVNTGRDIPLEGKNEPVNIFFYPLVVSGDEEVEGVETSFTYNANSGD